MNNQDHKPLLDNSFSAFIMGLTVGIAGALLLGTEEGRKVSQKMIDSIPENLRPDKLFNNQSATPTPPTRVIPAPDDFSPSDSLAQESPPPPPPSPIKRHESSPKNFFNQFGQDLG